MIEAALIGAPVIEEALIGEALISKSVIEGALIGEAPSSEPVIDAALINEAPISEVPIVVKGEKVALGPLRRELVPLFLRWMRDLEGTHPPCAADLQSSSEAEDAWYEGACAPDRRTFVIYELAGMRPVGVCGLFDLDLAHRRCEFGIAIGDRGCWGLGFASEATRLCVGYAFSALGVQNVLLRAQADNAAAIAAYTRAGFKKIGVRRGAVRSTADGVDLVYMDLVSADYFAPGKPRSC